MADRFPTPADDPTAEYIHSQLLIQCSGEPPFDWRDSSGQLLGVYASMPYTPHLIPKCLPLMNAIYAPTTLSPRLREIAVLAVASTWDAPYVRYARAGMCARVGISPAQHDAGCRGEVPAGIAPEEAVAYETARKLAVERGPLDDASWERAREALGREAVAGLAHVVAGYMYVCVLTSVAGPLPGGWTGEDGE